MRAIPREHSEVDGHFPKCRQADTGKVGAVSKQHQSGAGPPRPDDRRVDAMQQSTEPVERARADLKRRARFLEATLSAIPDFVYGFDTQHRFAYANPPCWRCSAAPPRS